MKKMRKLSCLVIVMAILLIGCGKEMVSIETFTETMEAAGLSVTEGFSEEEVEDAEKSGILDVAIAWVDGAYQLEFYVCENEASANYVYSSTRADMENIYETISSAKSASSSQIGNYSKYAISVDGSYYVIIKVENTVLYATSSSGDKDVVNDLISSLGY